LVAGAISLIEKHDFFNVIEEKFFPAQNSLKMYPCSAVLGTNCCEDNGRQWKSFCSYIDEGASHNYK